MTAQPDAAPVDDALADAVQAYLRAHTKQMLATLAALVRTESPTGDPEAQAEVQDLLTRLLRMLGCRVQFVPGGPDSGGHLYARPADRPQGRPVQLLVGHCDTVWPRGTIDTMPFTVDGNEVRGPGVFDMKGGLVQLLFALAALQRTGAALPVVPIVFINSDEERGSPTSRRPLRRLARCAHRAFVLEPALGLDGRLKTARKGGGRFTVRIDGESAHAGLDPEGGSSAILELSHVVQRLHALSDPEAGISVNVGTIQGGTQPNVIADTSVAQVDVRVCTSEQARALERTIRTLDATTPGTSLTVDGGFGRLPMNPSPAARRLWDRACEAARQLGIELDEGRSGGVSDANTISQYTPTLDGLGPVGDGAHARHEFCYVDKMVERSALLALLLASPPLPDEAPASDATTDATSLSSPS
jgi:glutamate carboxypeptidase